MRWMRACLLLGLLAAGTFWIERAALDPVLAAWRTVTVDGRADGPPSPDLAALVTGGCALLLVLAWLWLVAAVGACSWDMLRATPPGRDPAASSLLRPRMVRAVVATCLGASTLAGPSAMAQTPVARVHALPDDLRASVATSGVPVLRLLDGLPVPDRTAGPARRSGEVTADRAGPAARSPQYPPVRRHLEVAPGDTLWGLTAGLLPAGASAGTVARGWRLLYAANRAVVGPDPDLVQPGETLRVDPALAALVRRTRAGLPLGQGTGGAR